VNGLIELISGALATVCLTDDQRAAAEQLGKRVAAKEHEVSDARHAFLTALAEQVKAGTVDESALKDKIDAVAKARVDASPEVRKDFEDLHGILDKDQRATFVDAIEGRLKAVSDASGSWLESLSKDLKLSDDQKTAISKVLDESKPELQDERKIAMGAFDAFRGDDFSMEKIAPVEKVGDKTRARLARMIHSAKEITAILTPEQRAELADKIEAKAAGTKGSAGAQNPATSTSSEPEITDEAQEAFVAGRAAYRSGAVGAWGGGYMARGATVSRGYVGGYPFMGYGPGIW
jgi:Spy/CpxP family protein refolding chaperone